MEGNATVYCIYMNEVLHANIFFVITSIAVVLFTILVCLVLYHVLKIVKAVRRIVDRVEAGSEVIAEDLENLRDNLNPAKLIGLVMSWMPNARPRRRTRRKSDDE